MTLPFHGSNPTSLYRALSIDIPSTYIDFSVNLNPFGMLPSIKEKWTEWIEEVADYPEPSGKRLKEIIAQRENVSSEEILLGNGGAEIITLLASYLQRKRVAIVQPAFIEYEKMCKAYNCKIEHVVLREDHWNDLTEMFSIAKRVDAIFLCNPNNPTGITYRMEDLQKLMQVCKQHNCYLIIDEAFYDFVLSPQPIRTYVNANSHVITIRSLTKMYSIAGLRLGYLIGPAEIVHELQNIQPPWSVNAIAMKAGELSLQDDSFAQKTRQYVANERLRVKEVLIEAGYYVSESEVNFYILRDPDLTNQLPLIRYLLTNGIVPRHTENFRGLDGRWIRLAIKSKLENEQLINVLLSWKKLHRPKA